MKTENLKNKLMELSEGNPRAATAMMTAITYLQKTHGFGWVIPAGEYVEWLDKMKIKGSNIYVLFSDICARNPLHFLALLKSAMLGITDEEEVFEASTRQDYSSRAWFELNELVSKVRAIEPDSI